MDRFIVANSQQCLGCHACEIAYVMTHNDGQYVLSQRHFHPRITVIKHQQQRSAVIYHHCEDAPCTCSCPNDAISHVDDSIQVNQQKCIDCKSCVVAYPLGAMQIVLIPVTVGKVKATAHKCGPCAGRENSPAYVENCPADVLQLVTNAALFGVAKSRHLRTTRQEQQPWHTSTAVQEMSVMSKVEQMRATPARGEPDKLAIETCKTDFDEIRLPFRADQAQRGALRCLKYGGHSVCEWTCPLYNRIPQWIELVKVRNINATVELSHQTNTLPETTGRVCPQDRLYGGAYIIRDEHGAVAIGNIERCISDQALAKGWRPDLSHATKMDKRVTVIGAGPAGLVRTDVLIRNGVEVTAHDRHPEIGDLLTSGTPSFKLDKSPLVHHWGIFNAMGIHFELNYEMGKGAPLNSFLEQYDAVFVGVGTYHSIEVGLPNEDTPGVYNALPFLVANIRQVMRLEELPEKPLINIVGLNVVVLGGDDTVMDCVRTALCHGAGNTTCAYRRDEANMPGLEKEVRNAHEGGANLGSSAQPVALELNKQDHVCETRFLRTRLGGPDVQGCRRLVPVEGSEFVMPADAAIITFDFNPRGMPWLESHGVAVDKWGRIIVDVESQYRYQTTDPEIFASDDAVYGVDLVATAVAEGRHAAQGIIDWLGVKSVKSHR